MTEQAEPTDAMIEAGCQAAHELRMAMIECTPAGYDPEDMPDYDEGDIACAIYLAMRRAALNAKEQG